MSLESFDILNVFQNKKQNDLLSPEDSLYAKGFPPPEDLQTMKNFQESNDWTQKNEILSKNEIENLKLYLNEPEKWRLIHE